MVRGAHPSFEVELLDQAREFEGVDSARLREFGLGVRRCSFCPRASRLESPARAACEEDARELRKGVAVVEDLHYAHLFVFDQGLEVRAVVAPVVPCELVAGAKEAALGGDRNHQVAIGEADEVLEGCAVVFDVFEHFHREDEVVASAKLGESRVAVLEAELGAVDAALLAHVLSDGDGVAREVERAPLQAELGERAREVASAAADVEKVVDRVEAVANRAQDIALAQDVAGQRPPALAARRVTASTLSCGRAIFSGGRGRCFARGSLCAHHIVTIGRSGPPSEAAPPLSLSESEARRHPIGLHSSARPCYGPAMLEAWPEIERKTLVRFKSFEVHEAKRRSPRTGATHDFFLMDCLDWINILALTDDGKIVMVRQFRHGSDSFTLEIPGGGIDPGEDMVEAGKRELREESGYEARDVVFLGDVNPNPSIMQNRCGTILARGCRKVGEIEQDAGEDIEVVELSPAELRTAIREGQVDHALVFAALVWLELDAGPESLLRDDANGA